VEWQMLAVPHQTTTGPHDYTPVVLSSSPDLPHCNTSEEAHNDG